MSNDPHRRLNSWPGAAAAAVPAALDAAAEALAGTVAQRLAALRMPDGPAGAVAVGRDGEGRTTVAVTLPKARALEFGTRERAAQPFFRPAIASSRDAMRHRLAMALRKALPEGMDP